jgi:hypothetical protein
VLTAGERERLAEAVARTETLVDANLLASLATHGSGASTESAER